MTSHINVASSFCIKQKNKGSRMFTDGKSIYSYGEHFPIAHWISNDTVLFNTDKYSSSTSKHQSYVDRRLTTEIKKIECNTNEIKRTINYPEEPIIITREKDLKYLPDILEALKTFCNSKGVKRFPMKKFREEIEKMCFIASV